jgi:hypothetical protein
MTGFWDMEYFYKRLGRQIRIQRFPKWMSNGDSPASSTVFLYMSRGCHSKIPRRPSAVFLVYMLDSCILFDSFRTCYNGFRFHLQQHSGIVMHEKLSISMKVPTDIQNVIALKKFQNFLMDFYPVKCI